MNPCDPNSGRRARTALEALNFFMADMQAGIGPFLGATAIAGAAIGPAVVGITLGVVRQEGFNRQNGRNPVFNHAGNVVGAALSPALGGAVAQAVGYRVTFVVLGAFALGSLALWLAFRSLLRPACDAAGGVDGAALRPA